jgi:hypothetical protein
MEFEPQQLASITGASPRCQSTYSAQRIISTFGMISVLGDALRSSYTMIRRFSNLIWLGSTWRQWATFIPVGIKQVSSALTLAGKRRLEGANGTSSDFGSPYVFKFIAVDRLRRPVRDVWKHKMNPWQTFRVQSESYVRI